MFMTKKVLVVKLRHCAENSHCLFQLLSLSAKPITAQQNEKV